MEIFSFECAKALAHCRLPLRNADARILASVVFLSIRGINVRLVRLVRLACARCAAKPSDLRDGEAFSASSAKLQARAYAVFLRLS